MTPRRLLSRKVALSAAFLALAAGGTAACDAPSEEDSDSYEWTTYDSDPGGYASDPDVTSEDENLGTDEEEEENDEVFYCADEDGEIVDENNCDDDGTTAYFLWHSSGYPRGLTPGTLLDGGDYFPADDRKARRAFKLPPTGTVANGTVKTNIVGRSSGGSGLTGGTSGG